MIIWHYLALLCQIFKVVSSFLTVWEHVSCVHFFLLFFATWCVSIIFCPHVAGTWSRHYRCVRTFAPWPAPTATSGLRLSTFCPVCLQNAQIFSFLTENAKSELRPFILCLVWSIECITVHWPSKPATSWPRHFTFCLPCQQNAKLFPFLTKNKRQNRIETVHFMSSLERWVYNCTLILKACHKWTEALHFLSTLPAKCRDIPFPDWECKKWNETIHFMSSLEHWVYNCTLTKLFLSWLKMKVKIGLGPFILCLVFLFLTENERLKLIETVHFISNIVANGKYLPISN